MTTPPYPADMVSVWRLPDGTDIRIRPIGPDDAPIEQRFVRGLSSQSKYFRFMQGMNELTPEMLERFTRLDYKRELALIALQEGDDGEHMLGVARFVTNPDGQSCEYALVVADQWQHQGIGSHLMGALIDAARQRGLRTMTGEILISNRHMLELASNLGFELRTSPDDPGIKLASLGL